MDTTDTTPVSAISEQGAAVHPRLSGFALGSVLVALMMTLLLEALDQTVVGTALPRIVASLQGFDRYIWAVTAYILASCTLIPVVGKLSDQFGRKWFLVGGTVLFLTGSALCGLAQTMSELIAFRALQGLGAGMGIALVVTVIADIFPPAERAKWIGLVGAVYGVSSVIGPSLGGFLTDHGPLLGSLVTDSTRWRWIFYINLPVGIIALLALLAYLPATISVRGSQFTGWATVRRIDALGAALASSATICLLLGLTWGGNQVYDWGSLQVLGMLALAAVLFVAFVVTERFAIDPILPLDLFRNQIFTVATLLSLFQLMVLFGLVVYLPLFLQGVLGESASSSGAVITPMTFAAVVGAILGSLAIVRLKRYRIVTIVAAVVMMIGAILLTRISASTTTTETIIIMVILGLGLGPFFSVPLLAAQNALPSARLGVGTAAVRYMGQLGSVLGVAIVGTVVNNTLADDITPRLRHIAGIATIPAPVIKQATNPQLLVSSDARHGLVQGVLQQVPPPYQAGTTDTLNQIFTAVKQSLEVALNHSFFVILGLCIITFFCTLLLPEPEAVPL